MFGYSPDLQREFHMEAEKDHFSRSGQLRGSNPKNFAYLGKSFLPPPGVFLGGGKKKGVVTPEVGWLSDQG